MIIPTSDYLAHGGKGSGRYPLGSGERPYQHTLNVMRSKRKSYHKDYAKEIPRSIGKDFTSYKAFFRPKKYHGESGGLYRRSAMYEKTWQDERTKQTKKVFEKRKDYFNAKANYYADRYSKDSKKYKKMKKKVDRRIESLTLSGAYAYKDKKGKTHVRYNRVVPVYYNY